MSETSVEPKEAWHYCMRGQFSLQRKLYEKAIADLQETQRLNPEIAEAHYHLGTTYLKMGNKKAAKESFAKYLDLAKDTEGQDEWKEEAKKNFEELENKTSR